jgi:hypothetical protein
MTLLRWVIIVINCLLTACVAPLQVSAVTDTVEIYRPDGSRQCEPGSGISLSGMEKTLTDTGIAVLSSRRDHDCFFRPAVCGAGTSNINVYEIKEDQLSAAQALGFISLSQLQARCASR